MSFSECLEVLSKFLTRVRQKLLPVCLMGNLRIPAAIFVLPLWIVPQVQYLPVVKLGLDLDICLQFTCKLVCACLASRFDLD